MDRSYGDQVEDGRQAVKAKLRVHWTLGDLAIEVAGPAHSVADNRDDDDGKLSKYADDIDFDYDTLKHYRLVATSFRRDARPVEIPWTCFREVYRREDRHQIIARYAAQCKQVGQRPSYRGFQAFLGKPPTMELTKGNAEAQVKVAIERMTPERQAVVIEEVVRRAEAPVMQRVMQALPQQIRREVVEQSVREDPRLRQNLILEEQARRRAADTKLRDAGRQQEARLVGTQVYLLRFLTKMGQQAERWAEQIHPANSYLDRLHNAIPGRDREMFVESMTVLLDAVQASIDAVEGRGPLRGTPISDEQAAHIVTEFEAFMESEVAAN